MDCNPFNFGGLHPITPAQSTRYSKSGGVTPTCKKIPAGCFSRQLDPEPLYLPAGWSNHVQAEGQSYFYHREARSVTETNIYDSGKFKRIHYWIGVTSKLAEAQDIVLTSSIEVVLQLDEDNDNTCGYYLADHDSATIFWLQEVSSEGLDIPDSVSTSQLRWTSNELYWTHVEYFSAHLEGLPKSGIRELYSILTHARADHLTSMVGTFPYSAEQCKEFQDLLRDHVFGSSETLSDKYVICVVARLWAQVARHRFLNFYGEECARLSRDQRVVYDGPRSLPFLLRAASRSLLFDIPRAYASDLEGLWIDNLVYAEPWKIFVNRCINDWKETAVWTTGLACMHAIIYFSSAGSSTLSITALALSVFGFISSMVLANYHRLSMNYETVEAASYLDRTYHSTYGFAPLSWVYSTPKVLLFWSTVLMISHGAFALFKVLPVSNGYVAGSIVGLIVAVLLGVAYVLRSQNVLSSWIPFFRSSGHRDEDLERNTVTIDNKF